MNYNKFPWREIIPGGGKYIAMHVFFCSGQIITVMSVEGKSATITPHALLCKGTSKCA